MNRIMASLWWAALVLSSCGYVAFAWMLGKRDSDPMMVLGAGYVMLACTVLLGANLGLPLMEYGGVLADLAVKRRPLSDDDRAKFNQETLTFLKELSLWVLGFALTCNWMVAVADDARGDLLGSRQLSFVDWVVLVLVVVCTLVQHFCRFREIDTWETR